MSRAWIKRYQDRQTLFPILSTTIVVLIALAISVWRLYHPPLSPRLERWMNGGYILLGQGLYGEAEQAYIKALSLNGRSTYIRALLQKTRLQMNDDVDYVEKRAVTWLKKTPNDPNIVVLLGKILEQRGEFNEAIDFYRRAIKLDHNIATAWAGVGRFYGRMRAWDSARNAWGMAVSLAPKQRCYMVRLSEVYYHQRDYTAAINLQRHLISDDPRVLQPYYRLAYILRSVGNYSDALKVLKQANQISEDRVLVDRHSNNNIWYITDGENIAYLIDFEDKYHYGIISLALIQHILGNSAENKDPAFFDKVLQKSSSEVLWVFGKEMSELLSEQPDLKDSVNEFMQRYGLLKWSVGR